jgi:hypothetical protein
MALHTDLPIYRTGEKLFSIGIDIQHNMPRAVKRSLGEKITQHCMDMLELMALANATRGAERAAHIQKLMTHVRTATVLLRVAHGKRAIATKHWAAAVELLENIGKQGGGWLKSANRAPAA